MRAESLYIAENRDCHRKMAKYALGIDRIGHTHTPQTVRYRHEFMRVISTLLPNQ